MTWFLFCYWYEPDAPHDPVGLVRIWRLADTLANVGDRVTVFPPRYRSALMQRACAVVPIHLIHLPLVRPLSYAVLSFVRGLMRALVTKPDIVYYRWMDSPHALLLAKLLGVPCVCEVNGEPVPDWSDGTRTIIRAMKHRLAAFALKHCDRVVVLTEGLRELVIERYGVQRERAAVLPSGTDGDLFTPRDPVVCRRTIGLAAEPNYIGFVGSLYRYQGLSYLLEAMALVRRADPLIHLLVVGDGEAGTELKEQAERLGLASCITWTGRVPYQEVPTFIGAMTVCVAPFRGDRGETSPVKVFDYLACGRPVIASAIPSVIGAFSSDSGVLFVPPDNPIELAEAIHKLVLDRPLCNRMGMQGRRLVEQQYQWATLTQRLREWSATKLATV